MTASTDGGRAVKQQWLWNKLRNMHGSAEAAFEALQHKELRTQYGRLRASLGELSTGSSGGGLDLMESRFLAYREGKTHHQLPHQRREHVDGLHPSKYAYLLSTDEEFRFYEAGRLHFREEHLEAPVFRRLVNALVCAETGEGTATELEWSVDDVAAFFRLFDSSSFLVRDLRLHFEDFKRFYNTRGVTDPMYTCMETAAKVVLDAEGWHPVHKVAAKVATQTARATAVSNALQAKQASSASLRRRRDTLVKRVAEEISLITAMNDARSEDAPSVLYKKAPTRLVVNIPAKPTLRARLVAMDPKHTRVLSVPAVRLALWQFGVQLVPSEAALLTLDVRHHSDPSLVCWLDLLTNLNAHGVNESGWLGAETMRTYSIELQQWEESALGQLRGWEGDAATVGELASYSRLVSLSSAAPPSDVLSSPCFAKLLPPLLSTIGKLARFLRMSGGQLIAQSDLQYALKCGVGKALAQTRITTLMLAFEGPAEAGGLLKEATARMQYVPFLRGISVGGVDIYLEKHERGVDSEHADFDTDVEAVMASLCATVYAPYVRLREALRARDDDGLMSIQALSEACAEAGFADWDETDSAFVLRVFHSEQACLLEWEPFLMAVALAVRRAPK